MEVFSSCYLSPLTFSINKHEIEIYSLTNDRIFSVILPVWTHITRNTISRISLMQQSYKPQTFLQTVKLLDCKVGDFIKSLWVLATSQSVRARIPVSCVLLQTFYLSVSKVRISQQRQQTREEIQSVQCFDISCKLLT